MYSTKLLCASPRDNTHEASVLAAKVYIKVKGIKLLYTIFFGIRYTTNYITLA